MTFDEILMTLEQLYLSTVLGDILSKVIERVGKTAVRGDFMHECLMNADYFLAVALSLLVGKQVRSWLFDMV